MKILNPELHTQHELPLPAETEVDNEDLFKELMEKPSPKASPEKKKPSSFLAMLSQEIDEDSAIFQEEIPLEEEEDDSSKDQNEPQVCEPSPLLLKPLFFKPPSQPNVEITPVTSASPKSPHDVVALMEKMGSEMIVMTSEGSTKTTLILDSDAFDSSLLKETEITIEEFSSAPKIFNIKISGSPQALELVRIHVEEFLKLFQERKFGFSINRIDTELTSSRPMFSRKEKTDGEESDDNQGRQQQ